jgi:uracil-DNA glycosylase
MQPPLAARLEFEVLDRVGNVSAIPVHARLCQRQRDQNMPAGGLFDEIEAIRPRLIVALEATAPQSLAGRAIPVQTNRGKILDVENGLRVFVTIRPSALLRLQDDEERRSGYASFVNDLRSIEQLAGAPANQANAEVSKAG